MNGETNATNTHITLLKIFGAVLWDLEQRRISLSRNAVLSAVRDHAIRVARSDGHPDPARISRDIEKVLNHLFEIWDERLKNQPSDQPH